MAGDVTPSAGGRGRAALALAVVLVAGPGVWFGHLAVSYWLVPVSCRASTTLSMQVTTVVALAIGIAVALLAARLAGPTVRRGASRLVRVAGPSGGPYGGGWDFLVAVGAALAAFFVLVVVGAGLAALVLRPCV